MISILVLFLLLGVAISRHISYYDNGSNQEPMITKAQEHRICAELCMAGLGGEPCGSDCVDIIPQGLPIQELSQSVGNHTDVDYTRKRACPLLCENRLGYPLCNCKPPKVITPFFKVDFLAICSHFCVTYNYSIFGCGTCDVYKNMTDNKTITLVKKISRKNYNWNEWCVEMCSQGDGGSACNCDILPMSLPLNQP